MKKNDITRACDLLEEIKKMCGVKLQGALPKIEDLEVLLKKELGEAIAKTRLQSS